VIANKKLIKKDWCKTREVRQQVQTEDGLCKGKINNRFCYGQCNSFYIPSDVVVSNGKGVIDTMDFNDKYFRSCAFCMPYEYEHVTVRMRCQTKKGRKTVRRKALRTKTCLCQSTPHLAKGMPEVTTLVTPSQNVTSSANATKSV